jgi:hypothetical protein
VCTNHEEFESIGTMRLVLGVDGLLHLLIARLELIGIGITARLEVETLLLQTQVALLAQHGRLVRNLA